jgi:glycosyltransferase involved in cell wall biosynthesis
VKQTILIISQTFVPDPASVGQHVADVAFELARRGNSVRVYASARGYENPSVIYPRRENLHGADVRRFAFASFGKKSLPIRVLGTASFQIQAFFAALFTPRLAGIFFSTSPPMIGLPLCVAAFLRRVPVVYWAMDLNPDQLIVLGKLKAGSLLAKILEAGNRFILKRSTRIVALDRFMADRLIARGIAREKMLIMPPWPHEQHIEHHSESESNQIANPFRIRHGLTGKFVIMYSGNHSPSNPLKTILDAAVQLKSNDKIKFLFIGGGHGKKEVEAAIAEHGLTNVISLPYQPISELKYSLTAADVHIVSLGQGMVGIIHPCKIYGAMTAGKPILFLGPRPSHISDLLEQHPIGIHINHGDPPAALSAIERLVAMTDDQRIQMGATARAVLDASLSQSRLCGQFCDAVEETFGLKNKE